MSVWHSIVTALESELSDLLDVGDLIKVSFRLFLAAVLGGILGYERERKGKTAGLRTHMLVSIGSAFFVLVPKMSGMSDEGLSRVIQGLIAGIGFLCAGAIIKSEKQHVRGLTTAAGLWLTAAIGMAAGLGRDTTAILCTILAFVVLSFLLRIEKRAEAVKEKSGDDEQQSSKS